MPLTGLRFIPASDVLTPTEIARVASAATRLGFRKFRLTGGEPTLRGDLVEIVERLTVLAGVNDLSMTTNGLLLPKLAPTLRTAGLHRVNIHVDTLHPDRLKRVMRFATVEQIWAGIEAAVEAGFAPLKLNCVVTRNYNEADVVELARLTLERNWHVRFIELMPLGGGECASLALSRFVSTAETRQRIEAALGPLSPVAVGSVSDEARNYRLPGACGIVGFISPVSEPYCGTCNRMRLTAEGKLHLCLLHDDELDLRGLLRGGGSDDQIENALRRAVARKPSGHQLEKGVSVERKQMFQIGG